MPLSVTPERIDPAAATSYAAGSPLDWLFNIAAAGLPQHSQQERDDAVTAADNHLYTAYTDTLDTALDGSEWSGWTGHPAVRNNSFGPGAVVHLDGGWWLHHTIGAT